MVQRRGEAGGGAFRRWQRLLSRSVRVWDVGGVSGGSGEPRALCPGPHLSFYGAVRWRPTNHVTVGRPRAGRGPIGGDQSNSLPLDLTL